MLCLPDECPVGNGKQVAVSNGVASLAGKCSDRQFLLDREKEIQDAPVEGINRV